MDNGVYNESTLIQGLRDGDEQSYAAIYEKYAPDLTNYAASKLPSLEEARDIIQDIFVYLWEERSELKITHSLNAFLFTVAKYRIIDFFRHKVIIEKYADKLGSLPQGVVNDVEDAITTKELDATLQSAVNKLTPKVKEVYKLSREGQLSIKEIANQTNVSPQTVKNQLTTALNFLRSCTDK
ncbi:RNA polymerase sigma factor [Pedobacter changchengzhani]|nr:RNA polymerase sigma-70 factor [Pedobacter changchengzhani]